MWPQTKYEWLASMLIIMICVGVIGPIAGYSVNGFNTHSPLFLLNLLTFQVDNVPFIVQIFFLFISSMSGFFIFEMLANISSELGWVALAAVGISAIIALLYQNASTPGSLFYIVH